MGKGFFIVYALEKHVVLLISLIHYKLDKFHKQGVTFGLVFRGMLKKQNIFTLGTTLAICAMLSFYSGGLFYSTKTDVNLFAFADQVLVYAHDVITMPKVKTIAVNCAFYDVCVVDTIEAHFTFFALCVSPKLHAREIFCNSCKHQSVVKVNKITASVDAE